MVVPDLLGLALLLEHSGEDTTTRDDDVRQELRELIITTEGQEDVTRVDPLLLLLASDTASKLEDLSHDVLEDGGEVHGCQVTDTRGVTTLAQHAVDTANGELQVRALGARAGGLLVTSHFDLRKV